MKNITHIGRVLFALPFILFGLNHIFQYSWYSENFQSFLPIIGAYTVIFTGLIMIAAGISMIVRKYVKLTALTLAGLLFLFIITIHIPQLLEKNESMVALINMLKDVSLMGGSLMIAGMKSKLNQQGKE
ncbi:DoxX family membrane protein [Natronoflexus pectinivorans]|uniref:Putative membrane protein YphA (DoxX/SURF4 family) n=1 Tax=Natronoflexus pectinivorans TaxID=682526 RepID=A0A4R2G792_9BACT|nr:DoxX family membrane protein [Natronoflexus pectinivorans]TCO03658.1 putative membrane protein YphA (DoxX/SURF4 family) [Natronoflexus pectinivorans]